MREVNGSELLNGSDHEFVVNLYTVILNRWPDEEGYRHHLEKVENRPDIRRQMIRAVANSPEGKSLGVVLRFDDEEAPAGATGSAADPVAATAPVAATDPGEAALPAAAEAQASAPVPKPVVGELAAVLGRLKEGLGAMGPGELANAQRLLTETLAVVSTHRTQRLEARLSRLEKRLGG
ncbi:DUF4214 domain-containing protein [Roseomonas eburnea]|uniref:DUF4214 domain-containing protein n=1 Tax=Neoroseomonas eburnea TaxID=1346889 RepID=A0A9X9XIY4_9PROT|nr:DUF4214 domain-containing protein [Neoroseomonas eburnea]MBR0683670.1 DUF4214 domain-containing protein [Neoroseomonas eburnea]